MKFNDLWNMLSKHLFFLITSSFNKLICPITWGLLVLPLMKCATFSLFQKQKILLKGNTKVNHQKKRVNTRKLHVWDHFFKNNIRFCGECAVMKDYRWRTTQWVSTVPAPPNNSNPFYYSLLLMHDCKFDRNFSSTNFLWKICFQWPWTCVSVGVSAKRNFVQRCNCT